MVCPRGLLMTHNHRLQWTALRAAAEPERQAALISPLPCSFSQSRSPTFAWNGA
jgi:hypothetical protein